MNRLPEIDIPDEEFIAWMRAKTPGEKLKMMSNLHRVAQQILAAEIQHKAPFWSDEQVSTIVSWRLLNNINIPDLDARDLPRNG